MDENTNTSKFSDFLKSIQDSISRMTVLEIRTIVGDYTIDQKQNIQATGSEQKIIESRIGLLTGDITVKVSQELADDQRYIWLREFHAAKERQGHAIIQNNINTLLSLIGLYKQTQREQVSTGPIVNPVPDNSHLFTTNFGTGGNTLGISTDNYSANDANNPFTNFGNKPSGEYGFGGFTQP
jgi:hypothetical protein